MANLPWSLVPGQKECTLVTKSCVVKPYQDVVLARYHLRVRTGHHLLSALSHVDEAKLGPKYPEAERSEG